MRLNGSPSSFRTNLPRWLGAAAAIAVPAMLMAAATLSGARNRIAATLAVPVAIAPAGLRQPGAATRPTRIVSFAEGCRTTECHAAMLASATLHAPVVKDACAACHAADTGGHIYPVLKSGEAICQSCHTSMHGASLDHSGTTEVGCLACHNPHASSGRGLLRSATIAATCNQCHAESEGVVRHAPHAAGACTTCHAPHPAEPRSDLVSAGNAVGSGCRKCHPVQAYAVAHSPHTREKVPRSCLACHQPHSADTKALLSREPREMCVGCHKDVGAAAAGGVTHDAVMKDRQCISCHAAHSSAHPSMLLDNQAVVCATCHDKPLRAADRREIPAMPAGHATDAFVHGPVASGDCAACHSVHGSNQARLLKKVDPAVLVGDADTRNYAMCFLCHDSSLLLSESGSDTWFRNGGTNLHRTHLLSGDRSRTCSACHVAHAGNRPKLMADAVSFQGSAWKMPLKFTQTEGGGSCSPGCHEPMTYRRDPVAERYAIPRGAP